MSTRSVLAVAKGDSWEGVYCHMDGYPTWAGPEIWRTLRYRHNNNVSVFAAEELTAHPGGYSSYPDNCYCHRADGSDDGPMIYTAEDEAENAALFIEWVYVIGRHVLTVFKSVPTGRKQRVENSVGHWWMQAVYRWALVEQIDLAGSEPVWEEVEQRGRHVMETANAAIAAHV